MRLSYFITSGGKLEHTSKHLAHLTKLLFLSLSLSHLEQFKCREVEGGGWRAPAVH